VSPPRHSYVRLELLEGVVAYHSGESAAALQKLQSAQARWQKLQVGLLVCALLDACAGSFANE
jgi:hypothetical protein